MSNDLQTVTFQAAKTNSAPPPLPYHIEQGLRGEVGTTQLPFDLSRVSMSVVRFISLFVPIGVIWIMRGMPIVAAILAAFLFWIARALPGLFHSIPYLQVRRDSWSAINTRLLSLCLVIEWAAASMVMFFLIFYPPFELSQILEFSKSFQPKNEKIEILERDLKIARKDCIIEGGYLCRWQDNLTGRLAKARREEAEATKNQPSFTVPKIGDEEKIIAYASAVLILAASVRLAAYGAPFSSETGNAIWREPHGGYSNKPTTVPAAPEDPLAKAKRRVFDDWFTKRVTTSAGNTPETEVKLIFDDYRKAADSDYPMPMPSYDTGEFKRVFKTVANKEPVGDKYQGVSLQKGGLI